MRWRWVEKAVQAQREKIGIPGYADNWEWLALELEH